MCKGGAVMHLGKVSPTRARIKRILLWTAIVAVATAVLIYKLLTETEPVRHGIH